MTLSKVYPVDIFQEQEAQEEQNEHHYSCVVVFHPLRNLNGNISHVGNVRESVTCSTGFFADFFYMPYENKALKKTAKMDGVSLLKQCKIFFDENVTVPGEKSKETNEKKKSDGDI